MFMVFEQLLELLGERDFVCQVFICVVKRDELNSTNTVSKVMVDAMNGEKKGFYLPLTGDCIMKGVPSLSQSYQKNQCVAGEEIFRATWSMQKGKMI